MRTLLFIILLLFITSICSAYEKWELIVKDKDWSLYLDEGNIYQVAEGSEYSVVLRADFKKPQSIPVTQTSYKNGKQMKKEVKLKAYSEVMKGLFDLNKRKIYVQSRYYITNEGNIDWHVSPDDVFDGASAVYNHVQDTVVDKFKLKSATNNDNETNNVVTLGITAFENIYKEQGMSGVVSYLPTCYESAGKEKNAGAMLGCASTDVSGMIIDSGVSQLKKWPRNTFFMDDTVKARVKENLLSVGMDFDDQTMAGFIMDVQEKLNQKQ